MGYASICQHLRRNASLFVLSQCLLLATMGCNAFPGPDVGSDDETTATVSQGLGRGAIIIYLSDGRRASDVVVTLAGTDQATGTYYSDWEDLGGFLPGSNIRPRKWSSMKWTNSSGNQLDETQFGTNPLSDPYSLVRIDDQSSSSANFTSMRVTFRANINGYCHEDWEDISWTTAPIILYFDGNGANWDSGCYRGDMLRKNP
jgi:hypothetical protein